MKHAIRQYRKKLLLICLLATGMVAKDKIILTSPVLKMLDGVPFCLDGQAFRDMLHIRKESRELQIGKMNKKSGRLEGGFTYKGKQYTLNELAEVEREIDQWFEGEIAKLDKRHLDVSAFEAEWQHELQELEVKHDIAKAQKEQEIHRSLHKDDILDLEDSKVRRKLQKRFRNECIETYRSVKRKYIKSVDAYDAALKKIQEAYDKKMASLQKVLQEAKKEYQRINEPFLPQIYGTKPLLFKLIEESCVKRRRNGRDGKEPSYLLTWAEVPDGQEFKSMEKNIRTIQKMNDFLTDLANFFEDLVNSCPKGWNQCVALIKGKK